MFITFDDASDGGWPGFAMKLKLRARTWEMAGQAVAWLRENKPPGYRVEYAKLVPTSSSGRRVDLTVGLDYVDDREKRITTPEEAMQLPSLVFFSAMARSRDSLPPTESPCTPTP